MTPFFWLGPDADKVWADYIRQVEAEAERLRHLPELIDE